MNFLVYPISGGTACWTASTPACRLREAGIAWPPTDNLARPASMLGGEGSGTQVQEEAR